MDEARRAVDDALTGAEQDEGFHVMQRVARALAGVVDRHKEEAEEAETRLIDRMGGVTKVSIALGTGIFIAIMTTLMSLWFR